MSALYLLRSFIDSMNNFRMPNLFIASSGADAAFKIWDGATGAIMFNVGLSCPATSLLFFADETGNSVYERLIPVDTHEISNYMFTSGVFNYSAIILGLANGSIEFRDLTSNCSVGLQLDNRSLCHAGEVTSIIKRPNHGMITGGADGKIIYWKFNL